MISREEALDLFASSDLIGIGMAADAIRRKLHPEGVASYIIDRNINYTNFCTEYCSFCAFYRPMGHVEGYVLPMETITKQVIKGSINAQSVIVRGKVTGNIVAKEKIDIKGKAELFGDIKASRLSIEEGDNSITAAIAVLN